MSILTCMHSLSFECELKLTGRFLASLGFHLSATVIPPQSVAQAKGTFSVAVVFDRRRITSCNCTCNCTASWCAHVVALCLFRIHQVNIKLFENEQNCVMYFRALWMKNTRYCTCFFQQAPNVCLRAPVSESLSRLQRDQLQKFAQYLISELPQQVCFRIFDRTVADAE